MSPLPRYSKHFDAISAASEQFRHSLHNLHTFEGQLTDTAVVKLTASCPNLVHIAVDSDALTDIGLSSVFTNCSKIQSIWFTSSYGVPGKLQGKALDVLREKPELGKDLRELNLERHVAQRFKLKTAIRQLSEARKKLEIETGDITALKWSMWVGGVETIEEDSDDDAGWDDSDDYEEDFMDDLQYMSNMLPDSALGDFMLNQYANGNDTFDAFDF